MLQLSMRFNTELQHGIFFRKGAKDVIITVINIPFLVARKRARQISYTPLKTSTFA